MRDGRAGLAHQVVVFPAARGTRSWVLAAFGAPGIRLLPATTFAARPTEWARSGEMRLALMGHARFRDDGFLTFAVQAERGLEESHVQNPV